MKGYLNGWRRLGVCITAVWLAVVVCIIISQYASHVKGSFVYWSLPIGTIVGDGKATLPNGKVVTIDDIDPQTGRRLNAREIDWDRQTDVPKVPQIMWRSIVKFLITVPLVTWLAFEVFAAALRWIRAGFRPPASTS